MRLRNTCEVKTRESDWWYLRAPMLFLPRICSEPNLWRRTFRRWTQVQAPLTASQVLLESGRGAVIEAPSGSRSSYRPSR